MPTNKELLFAAQNEQLQDVAKGRITVLTGLAELRSFGGEDDYVASVIAIAKQYPDGIPLTKVREVLPDAVVLKKAIKKLKDEGAIDVKDDGRSSIIKPTMQSVAPPMEGQPQSEQPNEEDDTVTEDVPAPPQVKPPKPRDK